MALVLDALAAHRLTRLVVADTITEDVRWRIIESAYERAGRAATWRAATIDHDGTWDDVVVEDDRPPALATIVSCRWCSSVWVAFGIVVLRRAAPRMWEPIARALALSSAAALLAGLEDG